MKARRLLVGVSTLFVTLILSATAPTTSANAASDTTQRAFGEIAQCLNSRSTLNILFLVDASSSLQDTDPKDQRAEVLASSLGQLAEARPGAKVNFSLATFGEVYTNQYPWQRVDGGGVTTAQDWIRQNVPNLDNEQATDWLVGLKLAQRQLATSPSSGSACKILLWLTDGGINVPGSSSRSVDSDAIGALCGNDPVKGSLTTPGIMASIRRSGISVVGVLLKSTSYLQKTRSTDPEEYASQLSRMSYMRPIVESVGTADGSYFGQGSSTFTCGPSPIPEGQSSGALIEVSDANDLGLSFARVWLDASGGQRGAITGTNPFSFAVEPGIARAVVLLQGKKWSLANPAGKQVATDVQHDDPSVIGVKESSGAWVIEVNTSTPSAKGTWTGKGPSLAEVYLYSDLDLNLATKVQMDQPASVTGHVVDFAGKPVGLADYGSASLNVRAITESGASAAVPLNLNATTGEISGSFSPPSGVSHAVFDVTLNLTTKSGQVLKPVSKRFEVEVALGPGYPKISPSELHMSELVGPGGTSNGSLRVTADAATSAKVCLVKHDVTQDPDPARISGYEWSAGQRDCVNVAAGQTAKLPVSATNGQPAEGAVAGTLFLSVTPEGRETRELQVPFDFYSSWPPDPRIRALVLGLLSLFSIAFPWAILYLVNRRNSQLIGGQLIRRLQMPVRLSQSGIAGPVKPGLDTPAQLAVSPDEYKFAQVDDRLRSYSDLTGVVLTGQTPINPLGSARVKVEPNTQLAILGQEQLSNDLGANWFVVADHEALANAHDSGEVDAVLVSMIRSEGADVDLIRRRTADIQTSTLWSRLPDLIASAQRQQLAAEAAADSGKKSRRDRGSIRLSKEKSAASQTVESSSDWDSPTVTQETSDAPPQVPSSDPNDGWV